MKIEIDSIEKNNIWKLVSPQKDVKPIGFRWLFKIKRNTNGLIIRYIVCLVAKAMYKNKVLILMKCSCQ